MTQTLLVMDLSGKRDVVRARQRTRQITALLGYDLGRQATLAATVFYLAQQVLAEGITAALVFTVDDVSFKVTPVPRDIFLSAGNPGDILTLHPAASSLHLQQPLPPRDEGLPAVDLAWIAKKLQDGTALNVFEEMHRQNQELLTLHLELQSCLKELNQLRQSRSSEPAA